MRKSLLVKSNIVLIILLFTLSGIFIFTSYNSNKAAYYEQMENIHTALRSQIDDLMPQFQMARDDLMQIQGEYRLDDNLLQIQQRLNQVLEYDLVKSTFIFLPGTLEEDGKAKLRVFLGDKYLYEDGFIPGSLYEPDDNFLNTVISAEKEGFAASDAFSDEYGDQISLMSRLLDENGNMIGIFGNDFEYGKVKRDLNNLLLRQLIIGLIVSLVFVTITFFLVRSIIRPIATVTGIAQNLASGN